MKQLPDDDIELIERYFDKTLSAEETTQLEERLKSDFGFRKLYEREKLLVNAIRFEAAARDLDYLKALEKTLSEEKTRHNIKPWYFLAAAASVAILVLALWMAGKADDPQALYAEYFQPHANIFEPIVRSQTIVTPRMRAFQAYEQGDYSRASILLADVLREDQDAGVLMLLGNANLMTGETEKAKENFRKLISDYDDLDISAKWYLSLAHLKEGDVRRATAILEEIRDARSPHAANARELLDALK